ncbi:DUF4331 domain-containing protein [Paractinoplanes atraurantiacus]|uniref:DUF4331 domain-containing protein n=1 Tax=Paractinoplanes atraurantiacus TaxID=1036182 RepID=A0A285I250_9ACTN|nr:DUF4331 domain-containing protein [Actinoplanes atraurantiacus]SNY41146.1 protein of unknown function [Actinoplanes atraurantiacus]
MSRVGYGEASLGAADPDAESSDLYAFVSPDAPETTTIIANYGFLNLEFGDDVLYEIHIDYNGDARPDLTYQFRFRTELRNRDTFLYNTGPIESLTSENWNRRQFFSVTRVDAYGKSSVLATHLPCPPRNLGPTSTPDYDALAAAAIAELPSGERVFAGQRADAFFVDPAAVFEIGENARALATGPATVNSIAIQLPHPGRMIGVWTTASRRELHSNGDDVLVGPMVQVARRANPLFAELFVPAADRARWNGMPPSDDKRFADLVEHPDLAVLLPVDHPGHFPRLEALTARRSDLVAMLLTGIPDGLVDGLRTFTGDLQADMLRLDTTVPPSAEENPFGLLGGDFAGFPNGRRIGDDVTSVLLRAIAGATFPMVDETYEPDAAATQASAQARTRTHEVTFPYLSAPEVLP